jgi:glucoside 3-dehydrogenase (cytochrome c) hitch-hiker subunit
MTIRTAQPNPHHDEPSGITRREAMHRVMALMGGLALVGDERLFAASIDDTALTQAMSHGVGTFSAADIALLDEIAETILPETSTPGAKAAKTGAFMALMVTDVYTDRDQQVFRDGLRTLDDGCRAMHRTGFMQATTAQRLSWLQVLDREQKTAMEERSNLRTRYPAAPPAPEAPAHYFRMMKELALLGYFTSEIGYTQAMRYRETPGRFDPDVPQAPGDKSWAPHG